MQMSTALSNLVLALTSFGTALFILRQNLFASSGFILIGMAASCGTYRFSGAAPSPQVQYWYQGLLLIALILGSSLVASGFHNKYGNSMMSALHMGSATVLVCLCKAMDILEVALPNFELLILGVPSAAVVSLGFFSILHTNPFGILGAVLYVIAGAVLCTIARVSTDDLAVMRRVDWFHYLLAFANVVLSRAFTYASPHVFYKDN